MNDSQYLDNNRKFIASKPDFEKSKIIITGVPMDYTVSFMPGSRRGPGAIRDASYGLEEFSLRLNDSLEDKTFMMPAI